jgi:hypothetical protein
MLIYFKGNLPEKEACDSLPDSNNTFFRNFSASNYQLNLLILIMCRYAYSLQRSAQDKGLEIVVCAFF